MIVNNNVSNNVFSLVLARQRARICSGGLRPPMGAQRDAASESSAAVSHGNRHAGEAAPSCRNRAL